MRVEPVPFHLPLPGRDTMGFDGIRSISYRVHGLLHLDGEIATFEWSTTRHSERVSLTGVSVNDDATPPELLDVPVAWIADATLAGGWWRPRLVLRADASTHSTECPVAGLGPSRYACGGGTGRLPGPWPRRSPEPPERGR